MIYREFYRELGNLLYAMARADGKINNKEVDELRKLVKEELAANDETIDEFGSDLAYLTEFEFEFDDEMVQNSDEAYESFITFVKANDERINEHLRHIAYNTAKKIARAFRGKNKLEAAMLKNLKKGLGLENHAEKRPKKKTA